MIESLLILLLYVVIIGAVLWLLTYLVDAMPMEPHFRQGAKVLVIVVGIVCIILLLIRFLPPLTPESAMKPVLLILPVILLGGCTQSFQYARDQGGGCLASTMVGAAAGGIGGATIGAGTGQLAAIAGGTLLGGTLGYAVNPACHEDTVYVQPVVSK